MNRVVGLEDLPDSVTRRRGNVELEVRVRIEQHANEPIDSL